MPTPTTPAPWDSALAAARIDPSGDALGRLLEGFRPYLLHVANQEWPRDLRAKEDPADLVQQAMVVAQRIFHCFKDGPEEECRAWLRCILLNRIRSERKYYRNRKRDTHREVHRWDARASGLSLFEELVASDETASKPLQRAEWSALLDKAVAELPVLLQRVLRLHYHCGFSHAEIGRQLGRSENAVQKLRTRAVEELARRLESLTD
jgi:RNA polymerase sigma-70 factor (ECF subfamily)